MMLDIRILLGSKAPGDNMQIHGRIWHFEAYERVFLNGQECESVVDTADATVKISGKGNIRAMRHALAVAMRAIRLNRPRISQPAGASILKNFDVSWLPMPTAG